MNSRELLLMAMKELIDVAGLDESLSGCVALLSAACLAIANGDEDEVCDLMMPYCDRVTARDYPEMWAEIQAARHSANN